jgi:hypothetical protein
VPEVPIANSEVSQSSRADSVWFDQNAGLAADLTKRIDWSPVLLRKEEAACFLPTVLEDTDSV